MADQKLIRETLTIQTVETTEDERELGAAFNRVAWEALGWAKHYLRHGPEHARLTIVKQFLSASSKLAAADASAELQVHRETFQRELEQMTMVEPAEIEITPAGPVDAYSHAALPDPVYQRTVDPNDET